MLIFFLLTSTIILTNGQYPYPYNRRIYGRRPDIRYVLRNPLRSFNPLPDVAEVTTVSPFNEKCVPPKNTCKYDYDCPSYHKCCQDNFCGYKVCKKIATTIKPEESNEITLKPECSPCVECVISQYKCDFDYECPPCFTCCQDFYYVYKVCKHVSNVTTAAVTAFSTIPTTFTISVTTEKESSPVDTTFSTIPTTSAMTVTTEKVVTSTFSTTTAATTIPTFSTTIEDLESGSGSGSGSGDGGDDEWDIDLRPNSRSTKGPDYDDFTFGEALETTTIPVENTTFTTEIITTVKNTTVINVTTTDIMNVTSTIADTTISEAPTTINEVESTTPSWENTSEYFGSGSGNGSDDEGDDEDLETLPVTLSTRRPTEEDFGDSPNNTTETNINTIPNTTTFEPEANLTTLVSEVTTKRSVPTINTVEDFGSGSGDGIDDEDFETRSVTRSTRRPTEEDFTFTDLLENTTETNTTFANTLKVSTTTFEPEANLTTLISEVTTNRTLTTITPVEDFGSGSGNGSDDEGDDEDFQTRLVTRSTRRPTEDEFTFTDLLENTTDINIAKISNTTTLEDSTTTSAPEANLTTLIPEVALNRTVTTITPVEDVGSGSRNNRDDEDFETPQVTRSTRRPTEEDFTFTHHPENTTETNATIANTFKVSATTFKPEANLTTLISEVTTNRTLTTITPVEDFGSGSRDGSDDEDFEPNASLTTQVTPEKSLPAEDFGNGDDEGSDGNGDDETEENTTIKPQEDFLFNETKPEVVTPLDVEFINTDGPTFIERDGQLSRVTPTETVEVETTRIPTIAETTAINETVTTPSSANLTEAFTTSVTEAFTTSVKPAELSIDTTVEDKRESVTTLLEEEQQPEELVATKSSAPITTSKENSTEMFTDQEGSGSGDDFDDEEIYSGDKIDRKAEIKNEPADFDDILPPNVNQNNYLNNSDYFVIVDDYQ